MSEKDLRAGNAHQFKSNFGFLMAAVGSAVGLGNIWGFPYKMGSNGGFNFLIIYLVLAVFIGFAILLGELVIGRYTGKGVVLSYNMLAQKYTFVGWMGFLSGFCLLAFYTMLGGYCIRYMVANFLDIFGSPHGVAGQAPADFFVGFFTNPVTSSIFTVIFMAITLVIVMGGVRGGIEKFSVVAMPILVILLFVLIVKTLTLPGAFGGIEFMFKPRMDAFHDMGWIKVFSAAGGQMFFSISIGLGAMMTYSAYLDKKENLVKNSVFIILFDTLVAIMMGLIVMPAVFAFGMEPGGGPGLLFVSLQHVFQSMGKFGALFGFIFYFFVVVAAVSSSIAMFEVVTTSAINLREVKGKAPNRKSTAFKLALVAAVLGIFVSADGLGTSNFPHFFAQATWLETFDLLAEGIMMPLGALFMSLLIGWKFGPEFMRNEITLNGNSWRFEKFTMLCMKVLAPLGIIFILLGQLDGFFNLNFFIFKFF